MNNNQFTGSIKTLGNLAELKVLYVWMGCQDMSALLHIALLYEMHIRRCESPQEFTFTLTTRNIHNNQFTGNVNILGKLTALSELYVQSGFWHL